MQRLISLTAALTLLALAGCGGDDETTSGEATSGATGTQDESTGDFMSAKEFIDASIPDQIDEVKTIVGITPECEGIDTSPGGEFQVGVAINAAQAAPDTPLAEIVADQCGKS